MNKVSMFGQRQINLLLCILNKQTAKIAISETEDNPVTSM